MAPAGTDAVAPYLEPGRIGSLTLRNRLVRASTSETMAAADGGGTPELAKLYGTLAAGGAGLLLTGHIYAEPRGQASANQPGLHDDRLVESMVQITDAVHANEGRIFAEIGHAGSQTTMPEVGPIAPSATANEMYGLRPTEATPTSWPWPGRSSASPISPTSWPQGEPARSSACPATCASSMTASILSAAGAPVPPRWPPTSTPATSGAGSPRSEKQPGPPLRWRWTLRGSADR